MHTVTILGNGGAVSDGLPYNGFVIDGHVLVEMPPDVMPSLQTVGIEPDAIDTVYISHFHADHIFGLPFFILQRFMNALRTKTGSGCTVFGPPGIGIRGETLLDIAFGELPARRWMREALRFVEITDGQTEVLAPGLAATCLRMDHFAETYGFCLTENDETPFAYVPDTLWCPNVESILRREPAHVLIDLNGEDDDNVPVHIAEKELLAHIAANRGRTEFWGTHLKHNKTTGMANIHYPVQGDIIRF